MFENLYHHAGNTGSNPVGDATNNINGLQEFVSLFYFEYFSIPNIIPNILTKNHIRSLLIPTIIKKNPYLIIDFLIRLLNEKHPEINGYFLEHISKIS